MNSIVHISIRIVFLVVFIHHVIAQKTEDKQKPELQQVILADFQTKELPDTTVCGIEKQLYRVLGGELTELDQFPWMVALGYVKKKDKSFVGFRCGGSLINNRYVLTAAQCLLHSEYELSNVRLGEWDITKDPDCSELDGLGNVECADEVLNVNVSETIPHPYYSKRTGYNNVGLLRLAHDVAYTDYIRPICLPPLSLPNPSLMTSMTIAGWGISENSIASDIKRKMDVPLLYMDKCRERIGSKPIGANQFCAGNELEGPDIESCRGDLGGPLMRTYADPIIRSTQWYQEGVVSAGCPSPVIVYTRVSRYVTWIINVISKD